MNIKLRKPSGFRLLISMVLLGTAVVLGVIAPPARADSLYIGDGADNSVKRFNARTGNFLGNFVAPDSDGLDGPRGMIFLEDRLLVVNQNANEDFAGEILRYRSDGSFLNALVPCNPPLGRIPCGTDSPFIPRGLIRGSENTVLVADLFSSGLQFQPPGHVKEIHAKTGEFIRDFDTKGFTPSFFPRGIVRGPDGLIYVSVIGSLEPTDPDFDPISGYILRFNPRTGKLFDIFVNNPAGNPGSGCVRHLHRPEGLVFGPDNNLYVTSFRADATDNDKVLVFNRNGQCLGQKTIALDEVGQPRSYAQALLFGPNGRLFVPMNNTGEVRRYNLKTRTYDIFIPAGGVLGSQWFMTFGKTDPSTLKYDD